MLWIIEAGRDKKIKPVPESVFEFITWRIMRHVFYYEEVNDIIDQVADLRVIESQMKNVEKRKRYESRHGFK